VDGTLAHLTAQDAVDELLGYVQALHDQLYAPLRVGSAVPLNYVGHQAIRTMTMKVGPALVVLQRALREGYTYTPVPVPIPTPEAEGRA